jgi:hypothetical protein
LRRAALCEQAKGRALVVRLKQTEAKLEAAQEQLEDAQRAGAHAAAAAARHLPNGHAHAHAPPPKAPCPEAEVQCDLAGELQAEAEAETRARAEAAAAADGPEAREEGAGGEARESLPGSPRQSRAAAARRRGGRESTSGTPGPGAGLDLVAAADEDWAQLRPARDAPSAVIAERALAGLGAGSGGGATSSAAAAARSSGLMAGELGDVAAVLTRWLPAGGCAREKEGSLLRRVAAAMPIHSSPCRVRADWAALCGVAWRAGPVSCSQPGPAVAEESLRLMASLDGLLAVAQRQAAERDAERAELRVRPGGEGRGRVARGARCAMLCALAWR